MFSSESSANVNKNGNFLLSNHHQNAGLARYRSAPSSFLSALLSDDDHNNSGDEAEALMFSAFFNGSNGTSSADNDGHDRSQRQRHQMVAFENAVNGGGGSVVGSYTLGMESDAHLGMINDKVNNSCNSLARQSSSPAGFFNGLVMGNQKNFPSNSRSTSYMPSIPENGNDGIAAQSSVNPRLSNGLKRSRNGDMNIVSNFSSLDNASVENGRRSSSGLVRLPSKNASEMTSTAENFLRFQNDSIQIRAKRGCATHPRSIAERMRRTRISEKMKKMQDLFPNLDKQTNTADMLDMAVEYIKQLQNQVQSLTERKAKCVCPNKA